MPTPHLPIGLPVLHLEAITPLMRLALAVVMGMAVVRCLREAAIVLQVIQRGHLERRRLMIGTAATLVLAGLLPVILILLGHGL